MAYEDYIKTHILSPIGIENMHLGHSLLKYKYAGEVHYYGSELSLAQSVFLEVTEFTTWPYGGFYLEAMDSHGGWIASATDLVRFGLAFESSGSEALLKPETFSLMLSRPEISLWDGTSNYYAFGWFVRNRGSSADIWHGGSLPGTTTILYRTASSLTWAVLFNTRPDPPNDEFLVDIITEMGKAAVMNKVVWGSFFILTLLVGVVIVFFVRRRRRKSSGER